MREAVAILESAAETGGVLVEPGPPCRFEFVVGGILANDVVVRDTVGSLGDV